MKLRFEEKSDISAKDPCVVIQAERLSDQAREVMDYLEQVFSCKSSGDSY